jgi:hypothetical protein
MSASLAEVAPAVSTMLLGSKVTLYPRCSDMNLANACGNHAFSQSGPCLDAKFFKIFVTVTLLLVFGT